MAIQNDDSGPRAAGKLSSISEREGQKGVPHGMQSLFHVPGLPLVRAPEGGGVLEVAEPPLHCPRCQRKLYKLKRKAMTLYDLPRGNQPSILRLSVQYWQCRRPGHTPPHPLAGLVREQGAGKWTVTARLAGALVQRYSQGESVAGLQRWCGAEERTIWRILQENFGQNLLDARQFVAYDRLTHLGVDELFWRGRQLCVITDLLSGKIVDVLPDRSVDTLSAFLQDLDGQVSGGEDWNPVFATDMWRDYRSALYRVFGGRVRVVADRFHIVGKIEEDLQGVARHILLPNRSRRAQLRALRRDLLTAYRSGEVSTTELVAEGVPTEHLGALREALTLALSLYQMWDASSLEEAQVRYRRWLWARECSALPGEPFARLAFLLQEWHEEVFAYFDPVTFRPDGRPLTNAGTEAINGKLRRLERRAGQHARAPFAAGPEAWEEQRHFERFWSSALWAVNSPAPVHDTLECALAPEVSLCECGQSPDVSWQPGPGVADLPCGDHPVRARLLVAECRCPACGRTWTLAPEAEGGMSAALRRFLREERERGVSLSRLARGCGLSLRQVRGALPPPEPRPRPPAPRALGVQLWRWRGQRRWVLTDLGTGALVELLPDAEPESLRSLLASDWGGPVEVALLAHSGWRDLLPGHVVPGTDLFTASQPVQRALREVQYRYTEGVSIPARRQVLFKGHRRLILGGPSRRPSREERLAPGDDRERLAWHLSQAPELALSRQQREAFQALQTTEEVRAWLSETQALTQRPDLDGQPPLRRALHFGWRDATRAVEADLDLIVQGAALRTQGLTLAGSRRLLRSLRSLEAFRQPDFALLRRAALAQLGPAA